VYTAPCEERGNWGGQPAIPTGIVAQHRKEFLPYSQEETQALRSKVGKDHIKTIFEKEETVYSTRQTEKKSKQGWYLSVGAQKRTAVARGGIFRVVFDRRPGKTP